MSDGLEHYVSKHRLNVRKESESEYSKTRKDFMDKRRVHVGTMRLRKQ
jgi:hypothetical protein